MCIVIANELWGSTQFSRKSVALLSPWTLNFCFWGGQSFRMPKFWTNFKNPLGIYFCNFWGTELTFQHSNQVSEEFVTYNLYPALLEGDVKCLLFSFIKIWFWKSSFFSPNFSKIFGHLISPYSKKTNWCRSQTSPLARLKIVLESCNYHYILEYFFPKI